jgi:hypothetical protein
MKKEIKKKGLTEIVYILDRSGSMGGLEADTIGGFNSMIEKQKKTGGNALVTTILFDNKQETLHDRININDVPVMTDSDYYVRGCTALLDAVGTTIQHIKGIHKYAREEDKPEKTIFVITTDGLENASSEYSYDKIKKMVEKQQEEGWEFIFIGANIDSFAEAARFGIKKDRVTNYIHDEVGTRKVYAGVAKAVCAVMKSDCCEDMEENLAKSAWNEEIAADFKSRSK